MTIPTMDDNGGGMGWNTTFELLSVKESTSDCAFLEHVCLLRRFQDREGA